MNEGHVHLIRIVMFCCGGARDATLRHWNKAHALQLPRGYISLPALIDEASEKPIAARYYRHVHTFFNLKVLILGQIWTFSRTFCTGPMQITRVSVASTARLYNGALLLATTTSSQFLDIKLNWNYQRFYLFESICSVTHALQQARALSSQNLQHKIKNDSSNSRKDRQRVKPQLLSDVSRRLWWSSLSRHPCLKPATRHKKLGQPQRRVVTDVSAVPSG
jgi:hypothetical protein